MSDRSDTQELLERAKNGDREATETLFARIYPDLLQAVRFRLGHELRGRLDSLDLAQSVYLEAFRDLGQFSYRGEGSFQRWLMAILENRIRDKVDFHRARKRDLRKQVALDTKFDVPRATSTPSRQLISREAQKKLETTMEQLSQSYRDVILYRHYLQMPWEEVGDQMDRTQAAAKMLFKRALGRLRELYGEKDPNQGLGQK